MDDICHWPITEISWMYAYPHVVFGSDLQGVLWIANQIPDEWKENGFDVIAGSTEFTEPSGIGNL